MKRWKATLRLINHKQADHSLKVLQLCRHEELASLVFGMDHSLDLHQDCEIYDLFGE